MSDATAPLTETKRREIQGSFERQGFLRSMGARIVALEAGTCVIEMPFSDGVSQQLGFFHGGSVGAIADSAGGYAAMTLTPDGVEVLTSEYKINFLRPAAGDFIIAEGKVLKAGRSLTVARVDIRVRNGGRETLCAAVQQSIMQAPSRVQTHE